MFRNNLDKRSGAGAAPFSFGRPSQFVLGLTVVMAVILAPLATVPLAQAEADLRIVTTGGPVHSYNRPDPTSGIVRTLSNGTGIHGICEDHGKITTVNGVQSDIWVLLLNPNGNGLDSWVSAFRVSVSHPTAIGPELQMCGVTTSPSVSNFPAAIGAMSALSRAAGQIGHTNTPLAAPPQPYHTWAGWCSNFTAYINGLDHSGFNTAIEQWLGSVAAGVAHPGDAVAPFGALVFFDSVIGGKNVGHVAFSIGGGQLISTPAVAGQPVYLTTVAAFQRFLKLKGWAYPYFRA